MHEQHVRSTRHIRVASNREDTDLTFVRVVRKLPVEIVEVVPPNILDISRIHPSMAIGTVLDEHHRREVVDTSEVS